MDEAELQQAMEIANSIVAGGLYVSDPPISIEDQLAILAAAVFKLGGNTIRPRTRTAKGITPVKP